MLIRSVSFTVAQLQQLLSLLQQGGKSGNDSECSHCHEQTEEEDAIDNGNGKTNESRACVCSYLVAGLAGAVPHVWQRGSHVCLRMLVSGLGLMQVARQV